jgi:hypothetical protein
MPSVHLHHRIVLVSCDEILEKTIAIVINTKTQKCLIPWCHCNGAQSFLSRNVRSHKEANQLESPFNCFFKGTVGTGYSCCGETHEGCLQCRICNVDTTSNIIVRRRLVSHGWNVETAIQQASKPPRGLSASQSRQRHPATKNTDTCK